QQRCGEDRADRFQHGVYLAPLQVRPCVTNRHGQGTIAQKIRAVASVQHRSALEWASIACVCDRHPHFPIMAQLPILEFPDPRLRTVAAPVDVARASTPEYQLLL